MKSTIRVGDNIIALNNKYFRLASETNLKAGQHFMC